MVRHGHLYRDGWIVEHHGVVARPCGLVVVREAGHGVLWSRPVFGRSVHGHQADEPVVGQADALEVHMREALDVDIVVVIATAALGSIGQAQ